MYDSLDTLWLMGLKPQFERAVSYVAVQDFHKVVVCGPEIPLFTCELTARQEIRYHVL